MAVLWDCAHLPLRYFTVTAAYSYLKIEERRVLGAYDIDYFRRRLLGYGYGAFFPRDDFGSFVDLERGSSDSFVINTGRAKMAGFPNGALKEFVDVVDRANWGKFRLTN